MKTTPYWWEAASLAAVEPQPVLAKADTVIVGAGYTGLSAALTLARAGRTVQVFDKQWPGEGASTRNGGITSGNLRLTRTEMAKRFGEASADAVLEEGKAAREDLYQFISEEKIDCDFHLSGRFVGALGPKDYDTLARDAEYLQKKLGIEAYAVSRAELHRVIGTDLYYGGNVRMDVGGLHPAKLHKEMLRLAREAGVLVHGQTPVLGIQQDASVFLVKTSRGDVRASNVIVATNGYTDESDRWLQRRIVPVRSRIIATAELPPDVMARLMPRRMMSGDTRKLSYYYRPSPDGRRILFGGRDGTIAGEPGWPTEHLRLRLGEIFPELRNVQITHSWYGYVAMNRDMVPRVFTRRGIRYATGYCGSGVVWARWAGKKVALQLLGDESGQTAFDFRPPRPVPFFSGKAWFMPAVFAWMGARDNLAMRRAHADRSRTAS